MTSPNTDTFFLRNFNTDLSAQDEKKFQKWLDKTSKNKGRDVSLDLITYDLRGFWKSGGGKFSETPEAHATDKFKKPNHITFSDESVYHNTENPRGGKWIGGKWHSDTVFEPSKEMLDTTHPVKLFLKRMSQNKSGVKVKLPDGVIERELSGEIGVSLRTK
jgi:hypothetical protein